MKITESRGPIESVPRDSVADLVAAGVGAFLALPNGRILGDVFGTDRQLIVSMLEEPDLRGPCRDAIEKVRLVARDFSQGIENLPERMRKAAIDAGMVIGKLVPTSGGIVINLNFDEAQANDRALRAAQEFVLEAPLYTTGKVGVAFDGAEAAGTVSIRVGARFIGEALAAARARPFSPAQDVEATIRPAKQAERKAVSTAALASILTGKLLCKMAELEDVASYVLGDQISTSDLAAPVGPATGLEAFSVIRARVLEQHPQLAKITWSGDQHWADKLASIEEEFGKALVVKKGDGRPVDTVVLDNGGRVKSSTPGMN